jgi:hypothetical protein
MFYGSTGWVFAFHEVDHVALVSALLFMLSHAEL